MSEIKEWTLKFLSLHTVFHAFISKRGLKENALMFYLQCPFVLCKVQNPSKIIKMWKQPSLVSPMGNYLCYNTSRWNFSLHGGFTKFHTLICFSETWWSLVNAQSFTRRAYQSASYVSVKLVKAVCKPFIFHKKWMKNNVSFLKR